MKTKRTHRAEPITFVDSWTERESRATASPGGLEAKIGTFTHPGNPGETPTLYLTLEWMRLEGGRLRQESANLPIPVDCADALPLLLTHLIAQARRDGVLPQPQV